LLVGKPQRPLTAQAILNCAATENVERSDGRPEEIGAPAGNPVNGRRQTKDPKSDQPG
jgi:hypothetical protein